MAGEVPEMYSTGLCGQVAMLSTLTHQAYCSTQAYFSDVLKLVSHVAELTLMIVCYWAVCCKSLRSLSIVASLAAVLIVFDALNCDIGSTVSHLAFTTFFVARFIHMSIGALGPIGVLRDMGRKSLTSMMFYCTNYHNARVVFTVSVVHILCSLLQLAAIVTCHFLLDLRDIDMHPDLSLAGKTLTNLGTFRAFNL
ncbi:hypothetical protein BU17DRAFT_64618 [Hysterangium stoloniferum]|nr:hypothetical protein BU17DRAFT_64618 [Hysterangium stoloniferum]